MTNLFSSFDEPINVLVVGANGGLGRAFVHALSKSSSVNKLHAWARSDFVGMDSRVCLRVFDLHDEEAIIRACGSLDEVQLIIVATGVLHRADGLLPEKSYKAVQVADMLDVFKINVALPALIAKHTLPLLPRRDRAAFCCLSARVGSISDNHLGGWYSYRASKAALNQYIKTLSVEMKRTHPSAFCVGLHPGTVRTELSRPFSRAAKLGQVFSPEQSVANLMKVIDGVTPDQSGSLLAWDGSEIQF